MFSTPFPDEEEEGDERVANNGFMNNIYFIYLIDFCYLVFLIDVVI